MKKEIILFDLDGTMINSYPGIKMCVRHAVDTMGFSLDEADYPLFVGPPLNESFEKYAKMNKEEARSAVDTYRDLYVREGMLKFDVYEGVEATLEELKNRGKVLAMATSKPEHIAIEEMASCGLAKYFDVLAGSLSDYERSQKHEVIEYVLQTLGNPDIDKCLMVGDTKFDLEGAFKHGMDCIIVSYGFGSKKTQEAATAKVDKMKDILAIID